MLRVTILPKIETRCTNASPTQQNSMALGSVGIPVATTTSSAFALGRVSGERKIKKRGGGTPCNPFNSNLVGQLDDLLDDLHCSLNYNCMGPGTYVRFKNVGRNPKCD